MPQLPTLVKARPGDLVLIERRTPGKGTHYELGEVTETNRQRQVTAFTVPYTTDGATGPAIRTERLAAGHRVLCTLPASRYDVQTALTAYGERHFGSSFYTEPFPSLDEAGRFLATFLAP